MVYVNDFFITSSSDSLIVTEKQFIHYMFSMTNLGSIKQYLGVFFEIISLGIFLYQQEYVQSILTNFGMTSYGPTKVSMPKGTILITDMLSLFVDSTCYSKLVGKLIFLTITIPDLTYLVNRVSSYMA